MRKLKKHHPRNYATFASHLIEITDAVTDKAILSVIAIALKFHYFE